MRLTSSPVVGGLRARERLHSLAATAAVVMSVHAIVLAQWNSRAPLHAGLPRAASVTVRQLVPGATAALAPAPARPSKPIESAPRADGKGPAAVQLPTLVEPRPRPEGSLDGPAPTTSRGEEVPVYATQHPPSAVLDFEQRRGTALGEARLHWRVGAETYELALESGGGLPGIALSPQWTSRGGFDNAGIAPERFAVLRRGRERRAANFQRERGRISFSGPAVEYALPAGAQDRLSWMLQLAAVLQAEPQRALTGEQVSMWVVGAHGEADVWTFTALGVQSLDLPAGRVESALHLLREPRRRFDPQVEVWLDPARHHLPVQMRLFVRGSGESTEFRLRALEHP